MREIRHLATAVAVISLILGLTLGYYRNHLEHRSSSQQRYIRVLAYEGVLRPDVLESFKEKTRVGVLLDTVVTPQQMLFHLKENPDEYDVLLPYLEQVRGMQQSGRLMPLSIEDVPNLDRIAVDFRRDPETPSTRYFAALLWGLEGILVNTDKLPPPKSLKELFSNKSLRKKVAWSNRASEVQRLMARRGLLEPSNDADENNENLKASLKALLEFVDLQPEPSIEQLRIGHYYAIAASNGHAGFAMREHKQLQFVLPEEGSSLWMMGAAIPAKSLHLKWARRFVNFLLDSEPARKIVETSQQATTLASAWPGLPELAQASFLKTVPLRRISYEAHGINLQSGEIEKWLSGLK